MLQRSGGAAARPSGPPTRWTRYYLRIAPELYLKRLVVGGLEKVFEINRNFRNEGISTRHNPEFTMLEFYEAYQDYDYLMDLTESLLRECAQKVLGTTTLAYQGATVDLGKPFDRLTMAEAIASTTRTTCTGFRSRNTSLRSRALRVEVFPTNGIGLMQLKLRRPPRTSWSPHLHRRVPRGCIAARARERRESRRHGPLRALHDRA